MTPTRPVLRYHGGKWKLAPWILEHLPPHQIYVEPFGGAGSVLLRKPRSYGEIYNDMDSDVVNVFRVLRDPEQAHHLRVLLELTPFSREDFFEAYGDPVDDVDRAYRMIVRSFMGFGSAAMTRMHITGFRFTANRRWTTPAQDWARWPHEVPAFVERLKGVVVENRDAVDVIERHDGPRTLYYVDPPYPPGTRSSLKHKNGNRGHYYRHDMTDKDHRRLAGALRAGKGMVVISGYPCDLYDRELFPDWARYERPHMADGARPRTEVLWLNPAAANALEGRRAA